MKKAARWLDQNIEFSLMSVCLVVITVLTAVQVMLRYCFGSALSWVEEVVVYFNVWLGFIGASYAVLRNNNLRVDLEAFLPKWVNIALNIIAGVATFIFYVYLASIGVRVVIQSIETGQVSPASEIPAYWLYSSLLVGALLASFRCLQRAYRGIFRRPQAASAQQGD